MEHGIDINVEVIECLLFGECSFHQAVVPSVSLQGPTALFWA